MMLHPATADRTLFTHHTVHFLTSTETSTCSKQTHFDFEYGSSVATNRRPLVKRSTGLI